MNTLKQDPKNYDKGEAELLPPSFSDAIAMSKQRAAIAILKEEIARDDAGLSQAAFAYAVEKGAKKVVIYLLKHHALESLAPLGTADDDLFGLIREIRPEKLDDEIVFEIYFAALRSRKANDRLNILVRWGVPLDVTNEDGQTLIQALEHEMANISYPKNRRGELLLRRDRHICERLKKLEETGRLAGTLRRRKWIHAAVIGFCLLLIAVICFFGGYAIASGAVEQLHLM